MYRLLLFIQPVTVTCTSTLSCPELHLAGAWVRKLKPLISGSSTCIFIAYIKQAMKQTNKQTMPLEALLPNIHCENKLGTVVDYPRKPIFDKVIPCWQGATSQEECLTCCHEHVMHKRQSCSEVRWGQS